MRFRRPSSLLTSVAYPQSSAAMAEPTPGGFVSARLAAGSALLLLLAAGQSPAQQPTARPAGSDRAAPVGTVTVLHTVDLVRVLDRVRQDQQKRIGIIGGFSQNPINITTGLVLDESGHIITRLQYADPAGGNETIFVKGRDGRPARARLIGIDLATGFAVLEAPDEREQPVLSSSDVPKDGLHVDILNPDVEPIPGSGNSGFRVKDTLKQTSGALAPDTLFSKARGAFTLMSDHLSLQSDAGIAAAADGTVLGMIQASGVPAGMAYLYPVSTLRDSILKRILKSKGSLPAGWLGIVGATADPASARAANRTGGVVVREVQPKSTAEACGLKPDDIIVGVDNFDIAGLAEMGAVLSPLPAGSKITLHAIRDNKAFDFEAVLGERAADSQQFFVPAPLAPAATQTARSLIEAQISAGFRVRDLTSQLAAYFGAPGGTLVTAVDHGSPADKSGLAAGDVVVAVVSAGQNQTVTSVPQLVQILQAGLQVQLSVIRDQKTIELRLNTAPPAKPK